MRATLPSASAVSAIVLFTSCAGYRMHKAEEAYNLMAYEKAHHRFDKILRHSVDRNTLIHCADACRRQNELPQAVKHYHRADSIAPLTGEDAFRYGQVLMGVGDEHRAEDLFLRVLNESPEDEASLDLFGSCQGYREFYSDSGRFTVNQLKLPGLRSVFSAVPWKKGVLVTGEKETHRGRANPWNGGSFLDLYYCEKKTMVTWLDAIPLPGMVNGAYHEGPAVFSPDGGSLYFTRSNYYRQQLNKDDANTSHLKLFRAQRDSLGDWGDIHEFAYNGETFSVGHPALSSDGHTLYFASDREGGFGGSDIWRCFDSGSGWSEPTNLGPVVNTSGNELFPVINEGALYFSSTAHDNMGGLDIFETHEEGGQWSDPSNMHSPINTPHDDFSFIVDKSLDITGSAALSGYLSSDRDSLDHVYTFWAIAPTFFVDGIVTDDEHRFLPNTEVSLTEMLTAEDTTVMTGPDGHFRFPLKPNTDYVVKAQHPNVIAQSHPASTKGLTRSDTLQVDFALTTIDLDQPIAINNILYDYDEWDIREDAARELDKLARIFKDNPQMSFELGAHTDSRGGDNYNLVLSDARAYSAVNYLIQQGVDPDRIAAMGFGESLLINKCKNGVRCTEEDHQANRRTEFKVTGINLASRP
ncbi:MAG: OmpA family protein [Flavobacteriales bacterium]|nr:OmpA family protein [Flavobacteriales bacterium]MBL0043638.1 OmpA family protein [Flavobacteriales bacterium]